LEAIEACFINFYKLKALLENLELYRKTKLESNPITLLPDLLPNPWELELKIRGKQKHLYIWGLTNMYKTT